MQDTYPLALGLNACRMLGVDPADMLGQAGLGDFDPKQAALEVAVFEHINGFYNPRRRHSALGWKSPVACERKVA